MLKKKTALLKRSAGDERKSENVMVQIDETRLGFVDRLGLAYCRLNCYTWDEILGPKPIGFDTLPNYSIKRLFRRQQLSKVDYVRPAMHAIESIIGRANISRCWWLFHLGRTETEWFQWYVQQMQDLD